MRALEEARAQLVLEVRDPAERLVEAVEVVGEVTRSVALGARLSPVEARVVDAARTLVAAVEAQESERSGRKTRPRGGNEGAPTEGSGVRLTRRERRELERRRRKNLR